MITALWLLDMQDSFLIGNSRSDQVMDVRASPYSSCVFLTVDVETKLIDDGDDVTAALYVYLSAYFPEK